MKMLQKQVLCKHPLSAFTQEGQDILSGGEIGAVVGRRGEGKTALLVQIALHEMLKGKNVLHVSLNDSVGKVVLWYEELFSHLVGGEYVEGAKLLFDTILPHRFILSLKLEGMNVPRLENHISDLMIQRVFEPQLIIIDGMDFDQNMASLVDEIKLLAGKLQVGVWLSIPAHREMERAEKGVPAMLIPLQDHFSVMVHLSTEGQKVKIKSLVPPASEYFPDITLDPFSLLVS